MNYKGLAEAHNKVLTAVIETLNKPVQSLTDELALVARILCFVTVRRGLIEWH